MIRHCEQIAVVTKENGCVKHVKMYSYVAVLCEPDGEQVCAVRVDAFERKEDAARYIKEKFPGWNLKGVWKLYDTDFAAEG